MIKDKRNIDILFEERLKGIMNEIKNQDNIIVFIDEFHTLVGAGGAEGALDAANILKPALSRGEFQCIGATTLDEYRKHIEKDAALERRFQPIIINEPNQEDTIAILRGLKEKYEIHHGIRITDDAIIAATTLSSRYISDRFLPDKAIDLLDEASAGLKIEIESMPESLDQLTRKITQLEIEVSALKREKNKTKLNLIKKQIADLKEIPEWLKAYSNIAENIDIIWFNPSGDIPRYSFEVSHTSELRKDLSNLISIIDHVKMGFIVAPEERKNNFRKIRLHWSSCAPGSY